MRTFAALVEREVRERWHLLLAAFLLGLMSFFAAWLPQVRRYEPVEVRSGAALLVSVALLLGAAVVLGSSMIARSLAEGRLAFYYARPIHASTLWCGKLSAVLLLLAGAALLVWMPTFLAGGSPGIATDLLIDWPERIETFEVPHAWRTWGRVSSQLWIDPYVFSPGPLGMWVATALVTLVLLAHALSVALRSRSPRILLDLVLLSVAAALSWSVVTRLVTHGALGTLLRAGTVLAIVVPLALVAAGLAQVAIGRTSPIRAHAALSTVFWATVLPLLLSFEVVSRQVIRAGLDELAAFSQFCAAPRGQGLLLAGPARSESGYAPVFVVQPATGERRKVDNLKFLCRAPVFSADGRALVWESAGTAAVGPKTACEVRYLDLETPGAPVVGTEIRTPYHRASFAFRSLLALSGEGDRLAVAVEERLTVYSVPTGATLAAVRLPDDHFEAPRFVDGKVRLHGPLWREKELEVWEFDPASLELQDLGRVAGTAFTYSSTDGRFAVWSGLSTVRVYRTADLAETARVSAAAGIRISDLRFLDDSGFLLSEHRAWDSARIRRFDAAGVELWSLDLPQSEALLGNQPDAGRIWTGVWHWRRDEAEGRTGDDPGESPFERWALGKTRWVGRLLDLESGRVVLEKPGLVPNWHEARAGSPASRILLAPGGLPIEVDSSSGSEKPLLELSASR